MDTDMFPEAPIPLRAQVSCVLREIRMRERVYPRWVADGRMSGEQSKSEIACMYAVLTTLNDLLREGRT